MEGPPCLVLKAISHLYAGISLIPRTQIVHVWRAWYLFSCDHDVIEIGPEFLEQKGKVLHVIQQHLRSVFSMYDILSLIAR